MGLKLNTALMLGQCLDQICFGLYTIIFNFRENLSITTGNMLLFVDIEGKQQHWNYKDGRKYFNLNSILQETIKYAEFSENDELKLVFSNDEIIIFFADGMSESYTINLDGIFDVIS